MAEKLRDLYDNIEEQGLLEDRREYTREDLQTAYALSKQEADDLHWLIQKQFDPKHVHSYGLLTEACNDPRLAEMFCEGCLEALHEDFNGWDNEHDRIMIWRFLDDISSYAKEATEKEKE